MIAEQLIIWIGYISFLKSFLWFDWLTGREADHLGELVAAMEAQPGQAEAAKVQIADLKQELAASQVGTLVKRLS